MRHFTPIALVAALALVGFNAQAQIVSPVNPVALVNPTDLFWDVPQGMPTSVASFASATQLRTISLAQGSGHTGTPVLTTSTSICGGSTAVLTGGTDVSGQVAEGTSASTSCVITFATPFVNNAPECFVSLNNVADTALKCATTKTAVTITQTSASSNVLNYLIVGLPGG